MYNFEYKEHYKNKVVLSIDDLHEARANITELTRRLHELEIELRRLENEREELTAAYKEAEAVSIIHVFKSLSHSTCPRSSLSLLLQQM